VQPEEARAWHWLVREVEETPWVAEFEGHRCQMPSMRTVKLLGHPQGSLAIALSAIQHLISRW
jgi:hypothetical protein